MTRGESGGEVPLSDVVSTTRPHQRGRLTASCRSASPQGRSYAAAISMLPDWHSAQRRQLRRSRSSVMIPRCMSSTSSRQHARQVIDTRTKPGGGGSMRPASVPRSTRGRV